MPLPPLQARESLLVDLNQEQRLAVKHNSRRLMVVAGAGSGKTEVMARRVAWWIAIDNVPKEEIIAFTFTDSAAEELKFRIRRCLQQISLPGEDPRIGGMYIGTIHGFCLKALRDYSPEEFYMYDVIDDAGRMALIEQGYFSVLAMNSFCSAAGARRFQGQNLFLRGYDLLNEYDRLNVTLGSGTPPTDVSQDRDWCKQAELHTDVGTSPLATAFAQTSARYYAYLRARRFVDFSTVQSEVTRRLRNNPTFLRRFSDSWTRLVVDEVQDINPVQYELITQIVSESGYLTAVGDHRQAIYSFRGGRVDFMGRLYGDISNSPDGHVQELPANYRSTPRIIDLANKWAATISDTAGMGNPAMDHRRDVRKDVSDHHVAQIHFQSRNDEAVWIAATIANLVMHNEEGKMGAFHDQGTGSRGLTYSDIAILVRSSTDIRTYQQELRDLGIPAVVRGGPDLFSQPEVLLFLGSLGICSGLREFWGSTNYPRSMPARVRQVLNTRADPTSIVSAAIRVLRERGLNIPQGATRRLMLLCRAISHRLTSGTPQPEPLTALRCNSACRRWLTRNRKPRRIFPQTIFHWLLRESGVHSWGATTNAVDIETTLFHIGQLSSLVKAIETSGWTPAGSLKWRLIGLLSWGASSARAAETPLLASPDAVTVTTIHSAKGLEFRAVFLADVCAMRFPSNRARSVVDVPFDSDSKDYVDPTPLSDNENNDDERRLMYVALTRAERYLYVSASGQRRSKFFRTLSNMFSDVGGIVAENGLDVKRTFSYHPSASSREHRMSTSFSDLRYFLECPQDYYLRNVLGFTPTVGQEFGYGRGLHNLLRVVHTNPRYWAALATDRARLKAAIEDLIDNGGFYLRYTVGEPLRNLRRHAVEGVMEYVETYSIELDNMKFEPEREFETLISEENLLISGAIDVVRLDDPPQVSIVDFKSGDSGEENSSGLNRELMAFQIGIYSIAARDELEYEPKHGLIRYIGERDPGQRQVKVALDEEQLEEVRHEIRRTGKRIRNREFDGGPTKRVPNRCHKCDFLDFCPHSQAAHSRRGRE